MSAINYNNNNPQIPIKTPPQAYINQQRGGVYEGNLLNNRRNQFNHQNRNFNRRNIYYNQN
jgi:hypothetical protein